MSSFFLRVPIFQRNRILNNLSHVSGRGRNFFSGSKFLNTISLLASWEVRIRLMFPVTDKLAEFIYIFLPLFPSVYRPWASRWTENRTFQNVNGHSAPSFYIRKLQWGKSFFLESETQFCTRSWWLDNSIFLINMSFNIYVVKFHGRRLF